MAKKTEDNSPDLTNTTSSESKTFDKGLIKNINDFHLEQGNWIHARNAINNSKTGDIGKLGNEPANKWCIQAPYTIIGFIHIEADKWAIFSTDNTNSEIGYFQESTCTYAKIVNDPCLSFNTKNLIYGVSRELFDCNFALYWADGKNPDRVLKVGDIRYAPYPQPWPGVPYALPSPLPNQVCFDDEPSVPYQLLCDDIRLESIMRPICLQVSKGATGGELLNGSYFALGAYTIDGQKVSDYFIPSNVQSLFDHSGVGGSINITIEGIDDYHFSEFELVVVSVISQQTVAKRIGIYSTKQTSITLDIIDPTLPVVPLETLPVNNVIYDKSDAVYKVNDYLLRVSPTSKFSFNYQPLANQIVSIWQSVEYPEDYYKKGGSNTGYMRDEVYAFFIRWVYNTGDKSASFHIPGRPPFAGDIALAAVDSDNIELALGIPLPQEWQHTNTATIESFLDSQVGSYTCDGGEIIQEGYMGYWQSTEKYPDDKPDIWNSNLSISPYPSASAAYHDLCGRNIRHHKFPETDLGADGKVNHFRPKKSANSNINYIRVMGVRFANIKPPVDNDGLPIPGIVGYEILRGSRQGNKSIIAKGIINNMVSYPLEGISNRRGLFQNYPYNDLRGDNFLSTTKTRTDGLNPDQPKNLNSYPASFYRKDYFSFHSPETNFSNPYLSSVELKVYQDLYGTAQMEYMYPRKHPKNIFPKDIAFILSIIGGIGLGILATGGKKKKISKGGKLASYTSGVVAGFTNGPFPNPLTAIPAAGAYAGAYATLQSALTAIYATGAEFGTALVGIPSTSLLNPTQIAVNTSQLAGTAYAVAGMGEAGVNDYETEYGQNDYLPSFLNVASAVLAGITGGVTVGTPTFLYYLTQGAEELYRTITNFSKPQQHALQLISHCLYDDYGNNSAGLFGRNVGQRRRLIVNQSYIDNQYHDFNTSYKVNNLYRGRYVLLELGSLTNSSAGITIPNELDGPATVDQTRLGTRLRDLPGPDSDKYKNPERKFERTSSTYYAAIKQRLLNQYGQLENIKQIPISCVIPVCPPNVNQRFALARQGSASCVNNVISNSDFSNGLTDWTSSPNGYWIQTTNGTQTVAKSGNTALSSGATGDLIQTFATPLIAGNSYSFSINVLTLDSNTNLKVYLGNSPVANWTILATGLYTVQNPYTVIAGNVINSIKIRTEYAQSPVSITANITGTDIGSTSGSGSVFLQPGYVNIINNTNNIVTAGSNTVTSIPASSTDFGNPSGYISNLNCSTTVSWTLNFEGTKNLQIPTSCCSYWIKLYKYTTSPPLPPGNLGIVLEDINVPVGAGCLPFVADETTVTGNSVSQTFTGSFLITNPDPTDKYIIGIGSDNMTFGITGQITLDVCTTPPPAEITDICLDDLGSGAGVPGCMDPTAANYNSSATTPCTDCCTYYGCNDPTASNYNPSYIGCIDDTTDCCQYDDPSVVLLTSSGYGPCNPIPCIAMPSLPGGLVAHKTYSLFGGDTYVGRYTEKNSFFYFTDWMYGEPDRTEFDYLAVRNMPYPTYWFNSEGFSITEGIQSIFSIISNLLSGYANVIVNPSDFHVFDRPNGGYENKLGLVIKRGYIYLFNSGVRDFFVESEYNVSLRDFGDKTEERHYDEIGRDSFTDLKSMFEPNIIKFGNYYKYDTSLSIARIWYSYVGWGSVYPRYYDPQVAETCYQYRPDRIIYSLPAQREGVRDNWKIFLTNNYKDFLSRVIAVKQINKSGSIILFESDSPVMFQGLDQLETDLGTKLTIGDGGLFSQPMQNLFNADRPYEYGSSQNRLSVINTPVGTFWISQNQGKIFMLSDSLKELTNSGLKWWFAQYFPYQLKKYYPEYNMLDNPVAGVGCQAVYDNENGLLYFTKKDYVPVLGPDKKPIAQYNPDTKDFYVLLGPRGNQIQVKVTLDNTTYFRDASWTISYDPKTENWISFHDWHPDLLIPGKNTFMTVSKTGRVPTTTRFLDKPNSIWIHNQRCDLYVNYYGYNQPFEVEYIVNTVQTVNTLRSIEYQLEVYRYNMDNCYDRFHVLDFNFDEAVVYNTEQCSGLLKLNLTPKNNPVVILDYPQVNLNNINILYSKEENKYRFNQFYDITRDRGEFSFTQNPGNSYPPVPTPAIPGGTTNGSYTRQPIWNTSANGYNKVLNASNLNYSKNPLQHKKFRHYTTSVFLRRKISGDKKMLVSLVNNKNLLSSR